MTNASKEQPARLLLTAGEIAGIGPDLCVALAHESLHSELVVVADPEVLKQRAKSLGMSLTIELRAANSLWQHERTRPGTLAVLPLSYPLPDCLGQPDPANAEEMLRGLRLAAELCADSVADALVTAPVQKSTVVEAGIRFSGHTEFLAETLGAPQPVMLLVAEQLRVALATTHMPLSEVSQSITTERLEAVLTILEHDLRTRYRLDRPRIVVCGLNPHAGESGHLGHEDDAVIAPLLDKLRQQGMNLIGPLPADTAFTPHAGPKDAVLAMYHDQGLPVIKYAGFGNAVNVTLGLPIIRTSVDHGTALTLAGTGKADHGSLMAAITEAERLVA
ncbi:MAG: 4-hydroxythreonine-4-phosphate dehydrogenase PdxA [Pseudomonadota bacterium]